MAAAIAYAIQLLGLLPSLISAGVQIKDLVTRGTTALTAMQEEGRDPTDAEWAELNTIINALRAELHAGNVVLPPPVIIPPPPPVPIVYAEGYGPCPDNAYGPGGPFGTGCRIAQ